jgi:hypothetical protein
MLYRVRSYVRQHHIAFLALFVALGGGGAYAASLGGGTVRGFNESATNKSGDDGGTLAKLGGIALKFNSHREDDSRRCTLSVRASDAGQVNSFYGLKAAGGPKSYEVVGRDLKAGKSATIVAANFDEGAPGVPRRVVGQITWHDDKTNQVVTSVFHMASESDRCRFQGTLTGAG